MIKVEGGVPFFKFNQLENSGVINFVSTRIGGVSQDSRDALNLSFDNESVGQGLFLHESEIDGVDGMITTLPNICLCVVSADCLPIVFFESEKRIISILHSGWRGLSSGIIEK